MGTATPVQLLHTLPAGSSAGQSRSAAWSRPAEPFIRGLISPLQSRRLPSPCCLSSPLALSPPGGQSGHRACTAMPCEVTMGLDCWRLQRGAKWGAGPRSHPRHLGAPLWTHTGLHVLAMEASVGFFSEFLKSSKCAWERPIGLGVGPSERGSSPASGPSYSGQTRPNTRGDRQRRRGGLCPVSALLPVPGGFDRASPRWAVQSSAPNHPKDSPSLDLHLQGPPCHLGRLRRDAHMRSDGNSHPLLNYPLIGLFLRYI